MVTRKKPEPPMQRASVVMPNKRKIAEQPILSNYGRRNV